MSVRELYEELVVLKKIERDPAQGALLSRLEQVEERVVTHRPDAPAAPNGGCVRSVGCSVRASPSR